ncbi:MAG: hypothetical protein AAF423_00495 [Pseudomonadota bacterium]
MNTNRMAVASEIRKRSEAALDQMARMRATDKGEDYHTAYDAVCRTDLGRQALQNLEDATAILTGMPTSIDLEGLAKTSA